MNERNVRGDPRSAGLYRSATVPATIALIPPATAPCYRFRHRTSAKARLTSVLTTMKTRKLEEKI